MTLRILISDDHGLLRAGLRTWLDAQPGLQVVGEASDGAEVLRLARELHPDVVLMDISMPGPGGGIGATRQVCEQVPGVRVLILTMHEDEDLLREALRAGAAGYLVKRTVQTELIDAIRAVARGDLYIHPAMTRALVKGVRPAENTPATAEPLAEPLTPREKEVARLIVQGYTSREIAEVMSLSVRTVEFHRANLMSKLRLRSRVELMRYAESHGLLGPQKPRPDVNA